MATKKTYNEIMNDAGLSYQPVSKSLNDYQGHPWTKMYDDIVPKNNIKEANLKDLDYYARNFGIDTSVANLQDKFDKLTAQEYAQKGKEFQRSEDQYFQNMAAQNAQYQQGAQNAISQALAAGSSRGMQFANQFAAQNQLAEQNSSGALELALQRNDLKAQEAQAYTQNAINAEQTAYDRKANILGQAVADRANEVQRYAADTTLYSNELAARLNNYQYNMDKVYDEYLLDKQLANDFWSQRASDMIGLEGTYYNADRNLEGTKYNADKNYSASLNRGYSNGYYSNPTTDETVSEDELVAQYYEAMHSNDWATKNALEQSFPWLTGTKEDADAFRKEQIDKAKKSGKPVEYESVLGNKRYAMPDGTTLSLKDYEALKKKQQDAKAEKEKNTAKHFSKSTNGSRHRP